MLNSSVFTAEFSSGRPTQLTATQNTISQPATSQNTAGATEDSIIQDSISQGVVSQDIGENININVYYCCCLNVPSSLNPLIVLIVQPWSLHRSSHYTR